ncbi:MAG: hypothetical protein FJ096_22020 [Deltaproteobacteria bacterium]|nr:hypothetical protein [Deltaproteobacteria bacterium]
MRKPIAFAIVVALATAGCNHCEKLTEKICGELGSDCALWQEVGGPDQVIPGGRKVNKACGSIIDNELAYKGLVLSAKGVVYAEQLKRATEKGDKAGIEAAKQKLGEHTKAVQQGLSSLPK